MLALGRLVSKDAGQTSNPLLSGVEEPRRIKPDESENEKYCENR